MHGTAAAEAAVLQRRVGLDRGSEWRRGVEGSEKKPPNLDLSLGEGSDLSLMIGEVRSGSLGMDVQKARRQLKTMLKKPFYKQVECVLTKRSRV